MGSTLFNEWVKEERDEAFSEGKTRGEVEGEIKGEIKEAAEKIIKVLITRFTVVDKSLVVKIKNIESKVILDELFEWSLTVFTIGEFEKMVEKAIG